LEKVSKRAAKGGTASAVLSDAEGEGTDNLRGERARPPHCCTTVPALVSVDSVGNVTSQLYTKVDNDE
jgi:hypothetical protein